MKPFGSSRLKPEELESRYLINSISSRLLPDLDLSITYDIVSSKIYDKRDDLDFELMNFPFLEGVVLRKLFGLLECVLM